MLTSICCSSLWPWVVHLISFEFTRVFFYLMSFIQLKKIIGYYVKKCPTFITEKNWHSQNFDFFGKKIWRNALALKGKKVQGILGKRLFWHYCLQLSFVYKTLSQIFLNLFCSGEKMLLSEFLRKWGCFHGHNGRFPKYLGWKLKLQKTETRFCRWKNNDYNNINIFLSMESPCTVLLANEKTWKSIFNTNSELWQNRTEKQIMACKATLVIISLNLWHGFEYISNMQRLVIIQNRK